jgi:hypothetical protein
MLYLKQSTAATVKIGPFVDEDDGKTAETGLTISQADVRLSKNGGNMAQKNDSDAATHDEIGIYDCPLDTTDTNTLGRLELFVHESGALPVWHEYMVVTANWYDTMCSTDQLDVNVTNIEGSDATDQIRDAVVDDATRIDASSVNAVEAKVDTADTVVDAIKAVTDNLPNSGALTDLATAAALATVDGIVDTILVDTAELQGDLTDGGRLDLLIDAIKAKTDNLPADPADDSDIDSQLSTIDTVVDAIKAVTDNLTSGAIADAVWDEALGDHDTEDSVGNVINDLVEESSGTYRFTEDALAEAPASAGAGAITFTYTLTSSVDSSPVVGADVWVTSDEAGASVLASGSTDSNGQVVFYLDAGTVYVWRQKPGWDFSNPDTEVVS